MLPKIYCGYPYAQYKAHKDEILKAIESVCENGTYCLGPEVKAFEKEFAAYHDVPYCCGVGSGTDAISLTLKALGIGPGVEVITVSHTALATTAAIVMAGATPVLIDIEEDTFTLDPKKIEAALTKKTKAIIPVHLYGQPCDMDPILEIAQKYDLKIIEDCAQAHGATYKGIKVGTMGDAGCFSFYPTKNLGAIGDGGGVITKNKEIQDKLAHMRQYGWDKDRVSQLPGVVSRLDEIQAAILRVKLKHLDQDNEKRRKIATFYGSFFNGEDFTLPKVRDTATHAYHLYVIQSTTRDTLREWFSERGLECGIHYTHPVHNHPGYSKYVRISPKGLGITDKVVGKILSLPIYPELDINELEDRLRGNNVAKAV